MAKLFSYLALAFAYLATFFYLVAMCTPWWYTRYYPDNGISEDSFYGNNPALDREDNLFDRTNCFIDGSCITGDTIYKNNSTLQWVYTTILVLMIVGWIPWLIFLHLLHMRVNKNRSPMKGRRLLMAITAILTMILILTAIIVFAAGLVNSSGTYNPGGLYGHRQVVNNNGYASSSGDADDQDNSNNQKRNMAKRWENCFPGITDCRVGECACANGGICSGSDGNFTICVCPDTRWNGPYCEYPNTEASASTPSDVPSTSQGAPITSQMPSTSSEAPIPSTSEMTSASTPVIPTVIVITGPSDTSITGPAGTGLNTNSATVDTSVTDTNAATATSDTNAATATTVTDPTGIVIPEQRLDGSSDSPSNLLPPLIWGTLPWGGSNSSIIGAGIPVAKVPISSINGSLAYQYGAHIAWYAALLPLVFIPLALLFGLLIAPVARVVTQSHNVNSFVGARPAIVPIPAPVVVPSLAPAHLGPPAVPYTGPSTHVASYVVPGTGYVGPVTSSGIGSISAVPTVGPTTMTTSVVAPTEEAVRSAMLI